MHTIAEQKLNNRIDNLLLIQDQVSTLDNLKDKINFKIPCNNNTGYDFCKLENLPAKINFPEDLKNESGQTLQIALAELNQQMENTIDGFKKALDRKVALMYSDNLPVGQN